MIGLLLGKFKGYIIAIGAALAALFAIYMRGRADANADAFENELNEYVETRRRIDENTIPNDADAARSWLEQRQGR